MLRVTSIESVGAAGGSGGIVPLLEQSGWCCRLISLILAMLIAFLGGESVPRAMAATSRTVAGVVVTSRNESVGGVAVILKLGNGEQKALTDADGRFQILVDTEPLSIRVEDQSLLPYEHALWPADSLEKLRLEVQYRVPPVLETLVISAAAVEPNIERRNDAVYKNTLFSRDDQVFHTLDAGINAGQHEGGGKSLEIRRFGFNLDHGGVSGGLKVLVDDIQQNQSTQGHGQGYLGQLKTLTPELIQEVDILNGPFNAEYGDFSGLGVVHIRLRESLPDQLLLRLQGGSYGAFRSFIGYSPALRGADALIAYEASRTDGPFLSPLRYKRDNVTGILTWHLGSRQSLGFKFNASRNDFFSSGQIPLDEVAAGRLARFGFVDPSNGGAVRSGTFAAYYKREWVSGASLKLDGFLARSLFDLYSNFTFFLKDSVNGDGIRQHDSRLQEGLNAQYLRPFKILGRQALLIAGANFHDNQINVGLFHAVNRNPIAVSTSAQAHVTNAAGYIQQGIDLWNGRLHVDGGLRFDHFRIQVDDRVDSTRSGSQGASRLEPKANVSLTPAQRLPLTLYFNYGRGISTQDARGIVSRPAGPKISTTDFYQFGTSHHLSRLSLSTALFLIDRSNEQIYIPDDGSIELRGPSRSYGWELKSSVSITKKLSFNGGLTRVSNAFFRGTSPRVYLDSAPHTVGNAAVTLSGWRGLVASLRYRHTSSYRLDGTDASIRATGLDVLDLSITKRIHRLVDFNLTVDNLTNKRYFETQNYFESRLRPGDPVVSRIHGTPGYPTTVTAGLTFHLLGK